MPLWTVMCSSGVPNLRTICLLLRSLVQVSTESWEVAIACVAKGRCDLLKRCDVVERS